MGTAPLHIRGVHIEGFQSLRDVDLDLGPITIIRGDNSKGKSAIIRALQAAAFNRAGDSFITRNEKQAAVTLRMGSGQVVTWTKGRKGGASVDVDGEIITRAKNEWPPELAAILGMREMQLDTFRARLQFQDQFAAPFLIGSATGGQAAKVLANISRLDLVVAALALARGEHREAEQTAKAAEAEADALQVELDAMPDYAALLVRAEALQAANTDVEAAVARLDEATVLSGRVAKHEAFNVRWLAYDLPARSAALTAGMVELAELAALANTVRTKTPLTRIDVTGLKKRIDAFLVEVAALAQVGAAAAEVGRLRGTVDISTRRLENARTEVEHADAVLAAALAEFADRNVCPTCGQELPEGVTA